MTNGEAIEKLETDGLSSVSDMDFITNALEENDKLKDEIERLKVENEQLEISDASKEQSSIDYYNLYRQTLNEVKELKSELEQSVRLPCKVGSKVYEIKSRFTKCTEHDCEFDDYSCQGCECLDCDSIEEYYIYSMILNKAENILILENKFGKTIFLSREEAEQHLKGKVSE